MKKAVQPSVAPGGDGAEPTSGGGSGGSRGDGAGGSAPAGNRGPGAAGSANTGSSDGISHHCPGEGMLGGGGGSGGILSASRTNDVGGLPTGEGVLGAATGGESSGPVGALAEAAATAGPIALAFFALCALLLLVGVAGGLRALQGRLRSG